MENRIVLRPRTLNIQRPRGGKSSKRSQSRCAQKQRRDTRRVRHYGSHLEHLSRRRRRTVVSNAADRARKMRR